MSVYRESDIDFDFGEASARKHDAVSSEFPGVDFIIAEAERDIWLEVKRWERANIEPERVEAVRQDFLNKMQSKGFTLDKLGGKFIGTVAHLCLTGNPPTRNILYVALLESQHMDSALMLRSSDWLRGLVKRDDIWRISIDAFVVNLGDWNLRFPQYPATAV